MKIIEKIKNWWRQDHEAIARKRILNQMIEAKKLSVSMSPKIMTENKMQISRSFARKINLGNYDE